MLTNPTAVSPPTTTPGLSRRQKRAAQFAEARWMVDMALARRGLVAHLCAARLVEPPTTCLKRLCNNGYWMEQPCEAPPEARRCRVCLRCAEALGVRATNVAGAEVADV